MIKKLSSAAGTRLAVSCSRWFATVAAVAAIAAAASSARAAEPALLVFTKTETFRHTSIPAGVAMLRELGDAHGYAVDHTEDGSRFNDSALEGYAAVIFLSTTGNVLDDEQQKSFERYVQRGGAFVGIHAAADTEYDWPWYGELVGARFRNHPRIQTAIIDVADRGHPSTRMLPARWEREDEWYNYRSNPPESVHVLMTLDESSYDGGEHDGDHPISWCHEHDGGRSWYTGLGHDDESYSEPLFREHVLGGIRWAIGAAEGTCAARASTASAE